MASSLPSRIVTPKLRPCPFCLQTHLVIVNFHSRGAKSTVRCVDCGTTGPECDDDHTAAQRWNGRGNAQVVALRLVPAVPDLDLPR